MTPVVGVMTIVSVLVTVAYDKISLGYDIPILSTITLGKGQCMTDYTQRPAQSREISPPLQQGVTAVGQKTENCLLNADSLPALQVILSVTSFIVCR